MVKVKSHSINLGYPVYGARFVNDNTVIVAGGGGDGNNGIPNKMTAILIQPENIKKPIKRYRELTLNDNEDSVMSLDVGNGTILAGINENPMMMAKGVNKHLRKFKFENDHLKFVESCQIHPNTNSTIYQKITSISHDGSLGVIVMSDTPSSVYIIESSHDLEEKFKIVTDGDVKDVTISLDGKLMCYITSTVFEVISLITGRSVFKTKLNFLMSKIRFLDNNEVIISGAKDKDVVIAKFSISSSKIIQEKVVYKNLKGITSMDVNIKNDLTVLATSNYSLLMIRTSDLKVVKILNKVHEFAITKVVFSENGKYLASCSAANTVNVVEIPENFAASKSILVTIVQYLISIILIAMLAVGTQYLHENGYINVAINKAFEFYDAYRPQDSSSYFTMESISSFDSLTTSTYASTYDETNSVTFTSNVPTSLQSSIFSSSGVDNSTNVVTTDFTSSMYVPTDATLNEDYIVSSEITTDINYTVSTSSFSDNKTDADVDHIESTFTLETENDNKLNTKLNSEFSASITSVPTQTSAPITSKSAVISSLVEEVPEAITTPIKEITREVLKEITSTLFATQIETSIHTSVEFITSISTKTETSFETSTETKVATSTYITISTSVLVETYVKEVTAPVTITVESTPQAVIENNSEIKEQEIITLSQSTESDLNIQIEPVREIYGSPEDAAIEQEKKVVEELVQNSDDGIVIESTTPTLTDYSPPSIQIEPSKNVYIDPAQAAKEQEENVISELISKIVSNDDTTVNETPTITYEDITEALTSTELAKTELSSNEAHIYHETKSVTYGAEETAIAFLEPLVKDEL